MRRSTHGTRYSRAQPMSSTRACRHGTRGERLGLERLKVVLDVERVEHHPRDRVMADGGEVEAVRRPHPRVLQLPQRPHVGHDRIVPLGDGAQVLVVDRDLAPHPAEHRRHADVGAVEHHHGRAVAAQPLDHRFEAVRDVVRVGAGADDVVAARGDADQVGLQLERGIDLLIRRSAAGAGRGWRGWRTRNRRSGR